MVARKSCSMCVVFGVCVRAARSMNRNSQLERDLWDAVSRIWQRCVMCACTRNAFWHLQQCNPLHHHHEQQQHLHHLISGISRLWFCVLQAMSKVKCNFSSFPSVMFRLVFSVPRSDLIAIVKKTCFLFIILYYICRCSAFFAYARKANGI